MAAAYPQPPQYEGAQTHYVGLVDVNAPLMGHPQQPPQGVVVVVQQPVGTALMPVNSAPLLHPAPLVSADGMVPRAFDHPIADTYSPHNIGVVHKQALSDNWICYQCNPLCAPCALMSGDICLALKQLTGQSICDYFCWESKLKPRAYAAVHENRVEFNYPTITCCGMCVRDRISVEYFDQIGDMQHATCCTPFHCCWCIECSGAVMAKAPCAAVNCPFCCCRTFYPGLSDGKAFDAAYKSAAAAAANKQRVVRMVRH